MSQFGEIFIHSSEHKYDNNAEIGYIKSDHSSKHIDGWQMHADATYLKVPPRSSMLYITDCPAVGGDTIFVNTCLAYNQLSDLKKSKISALTALHFNLKTSEFLSLLSSHLKQQMLEHGTNHPVVSIRPEDNSKFINVNSHFTKIINNMDKTKSDLILSDLTNWLLDPRFSCRFKWTPGSIAWWDNAGTQHQAIWDYYPESRTGYRVLSKNLF